MKILGELGNANMRENCANVGVPWFVGASEHKGKMVIVGGGPSVLNSLDFIRAKKKQGMRVVACNAVHKVLRENGINPDIVAFLDPSPVVNGFIEEAPDESLYLVASTCHPSVFQKLQGRKVVMWHCNNGYGVQQEILDQYPDKPSVLIGGGGTITLRMLCVGHVMGYRHFHMYGVDSSYAKDGADHAYVKHDGPEPNGGAVMVDGKVYRASAWMVKQAEDFKYWYPKFRSMGCKVYVHGEGLIPDIYRAMNSTVRERAAA